MAEINYFTEKCWQIKEVLPINVTKTKNFQGKWDIHFKPMTIRYDTFEKIHCSITHMESYGISYDYFDGSCTMSVTNKGLEELQQMKNLINII